MTVAYCDGIDLEVTIVYCVSGAVDTALDCHTGDPGSRLSATKIFLYVCVCVIFLSGHSAFTEI